jgi:hypothetical protein
MNREALPFPPFLDDILASFPVFAEYRSSENKVPWKSQGGTSKSRFIAKQKFPSAGRKVKNLEAKYFENAGFEGYFCIQSHCLASSPLKLFFR